MPKVSVIIPVYNAEQYLRECLDSVINQTLKDIEIICVDDCSTDNSPQILDEYAQKDERIKVLHQKTNNKQGYARNIGIEISSSDYITFVDADDSLAIDAIKTLYSKMIEVDCDVVIADLDTFSECIQDERFVENYKNYYKNKAHEEGLHTFKKEFMRYRSGPVAKLFKKSIIIDNQIKFPENLINEDGGFHIAYFAYVQKIYYINKKIYNRRLHKESTMAKRKLKNERKFDIFEVMVWAYHFLCDKNLYKNFKKAFLFCYEEKMLSLQKRCSEEEKEQLYPKMKAFEKESGLNLLRILQKIFSINSFYRKYTVITILGIKIKLKRDNHNV